MYGQIHIPKVGGKTETIPLAYRIQTLLEFSQRADYEHLIRQTRGLIFLATPHFTDTLPSSNRQLAAIIRYETHNTKQLIPPIDLQAFVTCSRRFAELNLTCPILSCSEQVEVKAKAMGFSRRVQVQVPTRY